MATSQFVKIDEARLDRLASEFGDPSSTAPLGPPRDLTSEDEDDATLVLALDAINFGSGYHDIVRKRPGMSGARTMSSSLTEYVSATGPLDASRLLAMTPVDCSQIFGQELDGGSLEELMGRFAVALNDLGALLDRIGGARALIDEAGRSAEALAEALTAMPFYRDVEILDGREVAFYKRAQITAADLCRHVGAELFDDLDRLTAFADNLVPHVLRIDGALVFSSDLVDVIDSGSLLPPGERAEIEIRAAGVVAVEMLAAVTGRRPMDLDEMLWERGGSERYKQHRRHRSRSVFY
jgi:hypothetical protein